MGLAGSPRARSLSDIRGPTFIRGDIAYGTAKMMEGAESRKLQYLFKIRQTTGVGQLIGRLASKGGKTKWRNAGKGWEGVESQLRL